MADNHLPPTGKALAPGATRVGPYTGGDPAVRRALVDLADDDSRRARTWVILGSEANPKLLASADWVATTPDSVLEMLRAVGDVIEARRSQMGGGGPLPTLFLTIDEGAELLTAPSMPDDALRHMRSLLAEGKPLGVRTAFRSTEDRRMVEELTAEADPS